MTALTSDFTVLADGLEFPEGPIALPDGSVLLVEIARGTLTRISAEGNKQVVAEVGGGPNGAALGPGGWVYLCNNGGFQWIRRNGRLYPGDEPENYSSGRIERVHPDSGAIEVLYTHCNGQPLRGPNDLVFDRHGGFWFTDHGKTRPRERDVTGVFYAKADGSYIEEVIFPMQAPNGIGLSPDGQELYVAETPTGRLWAFALDDQGALRQPAERGPGRRPDGGRLLHGRGGYFMFDSLAVTAGGKVCVATLIDGGITIYDPADEGAEPGFVALPDPLTTNICFGGADARLAYVTLSSTGRLITLPWSEPGLSLPHS
ncbi:MAG: SMP-30/gluconolactonase/LRE family protein [Pseudomonadota bacterium]